jgi:hypothetical protein
VSKLIEWLNAFLEWVLEVVLWLPLQLYKLLCEGLVLVLQAIPVPDWMESAATAFGAIPSGVAYFLQAMEIPFGIAVVASAYTIRFLIRRIPFFG